MGRGSEQVLLGGPDQLGGRDRRSRSRRPRPGRAPPGTRAPCPSRARSPPPPRRRAPRRSPPARGRGGRAGPRRSTIAGMPAQPIATLTTPVAPGPAERVRDHDPEPDARASRRRPCAEPLGRGVRVLAAAASASPSSTLEASTPGVRAHEPVPGLGDHEVAAPGDDAPRLPLDPGLAVVAAGDHPALGLRHDLLRHRRRRRRRARPSQRAAAPGASRGRRPAATSGSPSTGRTSSARFGRSRHQQPQRGPGRRLRRRRRRS